RKDERISNRINRAGGLTPFAYDDGASLKRGAFVDSVPSKDETGIEAAERQRKREAEYSRLAALQQLQSDASSYNKLNLDKSVNNDLVGINLEYILKKPGSRGDLILEDGDVIHVPKELQTVKVSGEVLAPSTAVYSPSKGFKQYISQ